MVGPITGVLLPSPLNADVQRELAGLVASISSDHVDSNEQHFLLINTTMPIGGSYTGDGRPFNLSLTSHGPIDSLFSEIIDTSFGFRPVAQISVAADVNHVEDHRVMGELLLYLAQRFGGVIDFNGALVGRLPQELIDKLMRGRLEWGEARVYSEQLVSGLPGKLAERLYTTANGRTWASHIATVEFMRAWLKHPSFHMVK